MTIGSIRYLNITVLMQDINLKKVILRKLFRRRIIGGKHTAIENLVAGIPKHYVHDAKSVVKERIKDELIVLKSTCYGKQVSLNPDNLDRIIEVIED